MVGRSHARVRKLVDSNQHPRLGFMLACFPHVIARSVRCALPGTASSFTQDSNPEPSHYKCAALPIGATEACACRVPSYRRLSGEQKTQSQRQSVGRLRDATVHWSLAGYLRGEPSPTPVTRGLL